MRDSALRSPRARTASRSASSPASSAGRLPARAGSPASRTAHSRARPKSRMARNTRHRRIRDSARIQGSAERASARYRTAARSRSPTPNSIRSASATGAASERGGGADGRKGSARPLDRRESSGPIVTTEAPSIDGGEAAGFDSQALSRSPASASRLLMLDASASAAVSTRSRPRWSSMARCWSSSRHPAHVRAPVTSAVVATRAAINDWPERSTASVAYTAAVRRVSETRHVCVRSSPIRRR